MGASWGRTGNMSKKTIYDRLKEARTEAGLSVKQIDIAKEVGIKPPSVNKWAKEGGKMRLEHALQLAYSSGVCVDWLLTGRPPKKALDRSSTVAKLLEALEGLPEDVQVEVLAFAEFRRKSD